jgi:hypothetical protein
MSANTLGFNDIPRTFAETIRLIEGEYPHKLPAEGDTLVEIHRYAAVRQVIEDLKARLERYQKEGTS